MIATSSGEKSASAVIYARPAYLHGFEILPPATGVSTIKVYDSPSSATGLIIASGTVAAGQNAIYLSFVCPRVCNNGVYAALTGSATTYQVAFSPG